MSETSADWVYGYCQRTGFKVKAEDLVEEWTGLMVRRQSLDPRHPLLDFQPPRGEELRSNPTGTEQLVDEGDGPETIPSISELGANN